MPLRISNQEARRLWLDAQGMTLAPTGPIDLLGIIKKLGFVQLDTIRVVARAHDHILWSRNQNYREPMLQKLFSQERQLFEHFTHDASLIPMDFYPWWERQFSRLGDRVHNRLSGRKDGIEGLALEELVSRIDEEGPLSTHAFDTKIDGPREMWRRPPHKQGLDYLWYNGQLTTSHREGFTKFYDLTEKVIPSEIRLIRKSDAEQINWLCEAALSRLAFASVGDIQRFWEAVSQQEVKDWIERERHRLVPVEIESFDGYWHAAWAFSDIEHRLDQLTEPGERIRIMNPFDPVIRDRKRLERLFGFYYRIEIFVPEAKRRWGYYVYPLLQADRFIGRMEIFADRKAGTLTAGKIWMEEGRRLSQDRFKKLNAELGRFSKLSRLSNVDMSGLALL